MQKRIKSLPKSQEARIAAEHDIRLELKKEGKIFINISLRQLKLYNINISINHE